MASVEETMDPAPSESGPSLPEDKDHPEMEPTQEDEEGLFIPSFLEEALGGDGNLQIKMAHTMQALERQERRCFICQSRTILWGTITKEKMGRGPSSRRGLRKTNQLVRWPRPLCPVEQRLKEPLQSEECSLSKPKPLLSIHWAQKFGRGSN